MRFWMMVALLRACEDCSFFLFFYSGPHSHRDSRTASNPTAPSHSRPDTAALRQSFQSHCGAGNLKEYRTKTGLETVLVLNASQKRHGRSGSRCQPTLALHHHIATQAGQGRGIVRGHATRAAQGDVGTPSRPVGARARSDRSRGRPCARRCVCRASLRTSVRSSALTFCTMRQLRNLNRDQARLPNAT